MDTRQFEPVLTQVLGSRARTNLITVLVEARERWFTAAEICDRADVSQTTFHRDQKSVLLDSKVMKRREEQHKGRQLPTYSLADTKQAESVVKAHDAFQEALYDQGSFLERAVRRFAN